MTALGLVAGYLLGTIPSGVLLARLAGIDPRRAGSGNIGATNVARLAGLRLGLATLVADALKGAVAVLLARTAGLPAAAQASVGVAAVVGHVFPVTLGLRGGKGVATALGALLVLSPAAAVSAATTFGIVLAIGRRVSVASIAGAAVAPLAVAVSGGSAAGVVAAGTMAAIIVLRHRDNLRRLRLGTEPRI